MFVILLLRVIKGYGTAGISEFDHLLALCRGISMTYLG